MSPLVEIVTFLTSVFLLVSGLEDMKKQHSLIGPFKADNVHLPYWDLTGSSERTPDFIRLTSDVPGKRGAIWNNQKIHLHDWEFQMDFLIHGKGANLNGDGIAIWYAKEPLRSGPVFGSIDYFSGLAVFIDTYQNFATAKADDEYNYPYISVMVNNGTLHYNSAQDGRYTHIGGCHAKLRNLDQPAKIAVSYVNSVLMVFLDMEGFVDWKQCFKSPNIHLPTGYYFGVSASTGEYSDNHDVHSIKLLDMEQPEDDDEEEKEEKEDRSGIMPEAEHFVLPKEYKDEVKVKEEKVQDAKKGDTSQPASILKIVLYIAGLATIFIIATKLCRKYREQRRVRMEKRLY